MRYNNIDSTAYSRKHAFKVHPSRPSRLTGKFFTGKAGRTGRGSLRQKLSFFLYIQRKSPGGRQDFAITFKKFKLISF
jgi:hypothetical protein